MRTMWALSCKSCNHLWYSDTKKNPKCPRCGSVKIHPIKAKVEYKHRCMNQHTWVARSPAKFCPYCRSRQITTVKTISTPGRSSLLSKSEELIRSMSNTKQSVSPKGSNVKHSVSKNLMDVFNKDRPVSNCFLCDSPVGPSKSFCPACGSPIMSVEEAVKKLDRA
ncbi:MAG: hypothetical protein ACFFCZ_05680 [Promethearchaeota archaeon]